MMELVSGAIHIYLQKDSEGPIHGFKIGPKMTLKRMFDKFQAEYAKEEEMLQFFFLNSRVMKSETTEEVGMEDGARIQCFIFINFFLGRDLVEMDSHNISDHLAMRLVDSDLLDEAVRFL